MAGLGNGPGAFKPGAGSIPATQIELSVSCRDLADKDTFSKSDPICVLFTKEFAQNQWNEFGRTEVINDNLNPEFVKKFNIQYFFERSQKLKFELYDVDSPSSQLDAHDFLGRLECTLGEIVGSPGSRMVKKLAGLPPKQCGTISIYAEELSSCKEVATIQFKGEKLDKMDFFGKSDPFLVFSRANEDNSFTVVHKTEVIKNTLNPTWRPFVISVRALCNGDHDRAIQVKCYDWNSNGTEDFIGGFTTTVRELARGPGPNNSYECINPKKQGKKKYKNSGIISLLSCRIQTEQSFIDYLNGGMQMNFTVAVDFTASNGSPQQPNSLHYMNPYAPNQYANAITAVGEIIQDYDSDKMFPALGFGARIPPDGVVSHEFFLNGHPSNPFCAGIQGILEAYQRTLSSVQLYGPTNFAPVINHVAKFASQYQDGTHYFVLLILTDGVITDMPQTKSAIVNAASLPMSIIIVGVGNAEFDAMEELDGDDVRLSYNGRFAERDIVQFVPFRDFIGKNDPQASQAFLAKEVLAEIPDQVTGFMKKRGFQPRPPGQGQANGITGTAPPQVI